MKLKKREIKDQVRGYIVANYEGSYKDFRSICKDIASTCLKEVSPLSNPSTFDLTLEIFTYWVKGLCTKLDLSDLLYHNYYKANEIVGKVLLESPEEYSKFDNDKAVNILIYLMHKEILKEALLNNYK